ncbi:AbrB/MazE/SpoVT family DNA-binding domain-containing protein [Sphaerisporangium sp. NPDC088356]|uniref:AbrB/MazE/SpoVT family DNA-binding domain-containing protein n=1 Tax=Sphaerisporangium sp. NPDC088356 TaxID=3154871 RepID=UPI0034306AF8
MSRTTLRRKGQLTLPPEVRQALNIDTGDEVEFDIIEPGVVVLRGLKMIPADQAWFWTESWNAGEREASKDIANDRVTLHKTVDDMFDHLGG